MRQITKFSATLLTAALLSTSAFAADIRIGLQDDADVLDPAQSRTFVGRLVYTSMCDKLVDLDNNLSVVPQLATKWAWGDNGNTLTMDLREGVVFHDGTPFNAEAAVYTIERNMTMPESRRKSELASVAKVEAIGEYQIKFTLKKPDASLLAQLSDRAGMMISPKAGKELGANFGSEPVCAGPFKFVERIQQDRIVLEKFADYWNKDNIFLDKVTFLPIPDTTVRLANLRAGDLDLETRAVLARHLQLRPGDDTDAPAVVQLREPGRGHRPLGLAEHHAAVHRPLDPGRHLHERHPTGKRG